MIIVYIFLFAIIHFCLALVTLAFGKWSICLYNDRNMADVARPPFWGCFIFPYGFLPLTCIFTLTTMFVEFWTEERQQALVTLFGKPFAKLQKWYEE